MAALPQQQLTTRLNKMNNQLHFLLCFKYTPFVLSKHKLNTIKPLCWSPTKLSLTALESFSKCSANAHLPSSMFTQNEKLHVSLDPAHFLHCQV